MKVDTKKPQPSEFRQDLLRGIRWGTILLIAMLLSIAAYRVLSSSPATASEPKEAQAIAPSPEPAAPSDAPLKVVDAEPKPAPKTVSDGAEVPTAPVKSARVAKASTKTTVVQVPEPPARLHAPAFAPLPAASPAAKAPAAPTTTAFVAEPAPVAVDTPATGVEIPSPKNPTLAPPPGADVDKSKDGNRATRAVRSVGRLFRFGKKDNEAKQGDPSK